MYREIIEKKKNIVWAWLSLLVLLFALFVPLQMMRPKNYGLLMDLGMIVLLTIVAYWTITAALTEYEYVLIDTDFMFGSHLGSREKILFQISVTNIICMAPQGAKELQNYQHKVQERHNLCQRFNGEKRYIAIYQKDGKLHQFSFQPSEKLVAKFYHLAPDIRKG